MSSSVISCGATAVGLFVADTQSSAEDEQHLAIETRPRLTAPVRRQPQQLGAQAVSVVVEFLDSDAVLTAPRNPVQVERSDAVWVVLQAAPLHLAVLAAVPRLRDRAELKIHAARVLDQERGPALAVLIGGMDPIGWVVEITQGPHAVVVTEPDLPLEEEELLVAGVPLEPPLPGLRPGPFLRSVVSGRQLEQKRGSPRLWVGAQHRALGSLRPVELPIRIVLVTGLGAKLREVGSRHVTLLERCHRGPPPVICRQSSSDCRQTTVNRKHRQDLLAGGRPRRRTGPRTGVTFCLYVGFLGHTDVYRV